MRFNLKTFAAEKADDHEHNEKRLQKHHTDEAPEVITEKQLGKDRVVEKEELTEKQLEGRRTGGSNKITEKNLNDATGGLVKHRNTSAHDGDINKLEEQRVSNKKSMQEREKYENASSTPEKKRWWEHLKASSKRKTVTAQGLNFEDDSERWGRLPDTWSDEEGVEEDIHEPAVPTGNFDIEEIGSEALTIEDIKPVDVMGVKGLYISFNINPDAQMGEFELKEDAYNKTMAEGYDYLAEVEGFSPESFNIKGDKVFARLIGDEYLPTGKGEYESDIAGDNPFSVSDLQQTDVEGIVIGTVNVSPEMAEMVRDMDDEEIRHKVMDAIGEKHESISVEGDGIDLDNIANGEISFVGEVAVGRRGRPESYDNIKGDPIASNDFDIVVLSQSNDGDKSVKKN